MRIKLNESVLSEMKVEGVRQVLALKNEAIAQSPAIGTKRGSGFIDGLCRMGEIFIMILDIDKFFSVGQIIGFKEQLVNQLINQTNTITKTNRKKLC